MRAILGDKDITIEIKGVPLEVLGWALSIKEQYPWLTVIETAEETDKELEE